MNCDVRIDESDLIERVEAYVRHPVYAGSAATMRGVLADLEGRHASGHVRPGTYRRLRDLILGSPHFGAGA